MSDLSLRLSLPPEIIDAIAASVATRLASINTPETRDDWHLLDVEEVASRLGRSTRWVRERVKRGDLPYVRLDGGAHAFELSDIKAFAMQRRIDVRDEPDTRRLRAVDAQ